MTEKEEMQLAIKILMYEVDIKDVPAEVEKASDLVRTAVFAQSQHNWHDDILEALEDWVYEISSTTEVDDVNRGSNKLSAYWRWRLWMDCLADAPSKTEMLLQGLVGAAFDAARNQKEKS